MIKYSLNHLCQEITEGRSIRSTRYGSYFEFKENIEGVLEDFMYIRNMKNKQLVLSLCLQQVDWNHDKNNWSCSKARYSELRALV